MLLPELREHPGGLSPLFLIKINFGKIDFDCILAKYTCASLEASSMFCLFWICIIVLFLDLAFKLLLEFSIFIKLFSEYKGVV